MWTSVVVFTEVAYRFVGTPLVDKTGLTGTWFFLLYFASDQPPGVGNAGQVAVESGLPSFFTAMKEQIGLTFRATRGPMDVIVIESVQQPTVD